MKLLEIYWLANEVFPCADAMESLLLEEYARKEIFLTYEKTRGKVLQNSLAKLVGLANMECISYQYADMTVTQKMIKC